MNKLSRFSAAWLTCQKLQNKQLYKKLAEECLRFLEIDIGKYLLSKYLQSIIK